jgi:uncharacterized membrane protein SirB2
MKNELIGKCITLVSVIYGGTRKDALYRSWPQWANSQSVIFYMYLYVAFVVISSSYPEVMKLRLLSFITACCCFQSLTY